MTTVMSDWTEAWALTNIFVNKKSVKVRPPVDLAKIGWDPQTTLRLVAGPSASAPP